MHPVEFVHGVNTSDEQVRANVEWALAQGFPEMLDRRCIIVGGGPSAKSASVHALLCRHDCTAFALNNAWRLIQSYGFDPEFVVMMDARPENAYFVGHAGGIWLVASQCHPTVFKALKDHSLRFEVWHAAGSEVSREKGLRGIVGGGTVLSRTINIAYLMGFRHMTLAGVDSSYADDGSHHAYAQPINDGAETIELFTLRGTRFVTTGTLAAQADYVFKQMRNLELSGCRFDVVGDGLLPTMWRERQEDKANQDVWEPEKYRRMWDKAEYRSHSPAMAKVDDILAHLDHRRIQLVDFGCGSGKATAALREHGYDVLGVDFAANCLDECVQIPFALANLWGLPDSIKGDCGICVDVMEHIPPDKVDDVLRNIARAVPKCIFSISYRPDRMGALIGEKLHLSVHPESWWTNKLAEHFSSVTTADGLIICEAD